MIITELLNNGILDIADTALSFYINNRQGRSFMLKAADAFRRSAKQRESYESKGIHITCLFNRKHHILLQPSLFRLLCKGNNLCTEAEETNSLNAAEWQRIFNEASELGISFILLAGGEPLMRRDVLEAAAGQENIIFPIFTNGTLIDDSYLNLFGKCRNLIPILSIEGSDAETDWRRGADVSAKVRQAALKLREKRLLYGASITVTRKTY
jgi:hypothetical protein